MISVMIKTTGHSKTPAVRLNEKLFPKSRRSAGAIPSDFSSENNFTPMISAIKALAIKNPPSMMNNLVDLSLIMLWII
jgi:hypothetical protein